MSLPRDHIITSYLVLPAAIISSIIAVLTISISGYVMYQLNRFHKQKRTTDAKELNVNTSANKRNSKTKSSFKPQQKVKDDKAKSYVKRTATVLLLGNSGCAFFNAVYCIYLIFDPYQDDAVFYKYHNSHFLRIISTVSWYIGAVAIIWFFNGRLYFIFKGSLYRYPRNAFLTTNIAVTLMCIVSVFIAYYGVYTGNLIVAEIAFNSFRIAYQVITFMLLFMFSKRLLLLISLQVSSHFIQPKKTEMQTTAGTATGTEQTPQRQNLSMQISVNSSSDHNPNRNHKIHISGDVSNMSATPSSAGHAIPFLNITAKNVVLVLVTWVSVSLVTFFWFSFRFIFLPQTRLTLLIPMNMASIDSLVNCISTLMLFSFGENVYKKMCGGCNRCFVNVCIHCVENWRT